VLSFPLAISAVISSPALVAAVNDRVTEVFADRMVHLVEWPADRLFS
jgi:hypothetical protein